MIRGRLFFRIMFPLIVYPALLLKYGVAEEENLLDIVLFWPLLFVNILIFMIPFWIGVEIYAKNSWDNNGKPTR